MEKRSISITVSLSLKQCSKCHKLLPESSFSKCSGGNYLRSECRACNNKLSRERRELKKKYGNPPAGYHCPICNKTEDKLQGLGNKKNGAWVVDHDHDTKEFRGWLCHQCNRGLGSFKDDVHTLHRAIQYLQKTQPKKWWQVWKK